MTPAEIRDEIRREVGAQIDARMIHVEAALEALEGTAVATLDEVLSVDRTARSRAAAEVERMVRG